MQYIRFYAIIGVIFIAFCVGAFHYKYFKHTFFRYFFYFLGYSLLGELVSLVLIKLETTGSIPVYNLYSLIAPVFLAFFFRHYMKNKLYRNTIIGLVLLYLVVFLVNSIYYQNFFTTMQSNVWIVDNLMNMIVIVLYLADILRSDVSFKLRMLPEFWVAMGYFFFALCFIPVFVIARYIEYTGVFDYLLLSANVINMLCIMKGFIATKNHYNLNSRM